MIGIVKYLLTTIEPDYYKWTQWIFLQIYKSELEYQFQLIGVPCLALCWPMRRWLMVSVNGTVIL
ncbi:hypothetical protein AAHE18_04G148600 [Arachis hypogaea]